MTALIVTKLKKGVPNIEERLAVFKRRYEILFGQKEGPTETILILDECTGADPALDTVVWTLFQDLPECKYLLSAKDILPEHKPLSRVIIITDLDISTRQIYYDILGNGVSPDKVRFFFIDEDDGV